MYYPNIVQSTPAGIWPNTYQINTQQQQAMPGLYYQSPSVTIPSYPATTMPEVIVQQQQQVPTVYYQSPSYPATTMPEVIVQQQQQVPTVYYQSSSYPATTMPEVIVQQQQQQVPTVYYQSPSYPATTMPEVIVQQQQQQQVPTTYYQPPPVTVPPISTTATSSEVIVQQPQPTTSTTTTKTVTTRILDPTTLPTVGNKSIIEETTTTIVDGKPEVPAAQTIVTSTTADVPPVTTTTTVAPTIARTTIHERPRNRLRGMRTLSSSTYSDDTTISTNPTTITQPPIVNQQTIFPSLVPIHPTTTIAPGHRVIHHAHRPETPNGYYSSDLDYGKRKVYKTDYKYRHYYCCNVCKGRCDLHNRSYSCCEWFYGCPVWAFIFCGLFFLALLAGFFTLFALQPSINPTRRAETAETRLINRTQIIYGFYQNCGYQVNATNTPTTLILCTNTGTTTTARIELSSFYTVISGTNYFSYNRILFFILLFIHFKISSI